MAGVRRVSVFAVAVVLAACAASGTTPTPPSDGAPTLTPAPTETAAVVPSMAQTPTPSQATPTATPAPTSTPEPTPELGKAATRIVISSLEIDLPVVELPEPPTPPYCNVATRWSGLFVPPGLPGATYVLAPARPGMFLPLLDASQVNDGSAMIGTSVDVYTAANWRFTYAISAVHRHVDSSTRDALDAPLSATTPELWLQTGEGPRGSRTVLIVRAKLVSATPSTQADAQPLAQPVACP